MRDIPVDPKKAWHSSLLRFHTTTRVFTMEQTDNGRHNGWVVEQDTNAINDWNYDKNSSGFPGAIKKELVKEVVAFSAQNNPSNPSAVISFDQTCIIHTTDGRCFRVHETVDEIIRQL